MKQRISQIVSAIFYNAYIRGLLIGTIYQGQFKHFCCPGFNCYSCPSALFACPIGIIQFFVAYGPYYVSFYTLGILGTIGSIGGRIVCGWACPFGLLQDLIYKIKFPKLQIPKILYGGKYLILIFLVIIIPWYTKEPWFSKLCPAGTLEAGIPHVLYNPDLRLLIGTIFTLKIGILLFFLVWMMISCRPFCRTTCPLGAIYSLFNKVSLFKIEVDETRCNKCNHCFKMCPVGMRIYEEGGSTTNCIRCLRCTDCPAGAVTFSIKSMRHYPKEKTVTDNVSAGRETKR